MELMKTWCLLPLAVLLLLSIVPTVAEVVKLMSDCAESLLQQTPPHVRGILEGGKILGQNRYKPICQTLNNMRTFVTLYDTENRIPVFSAYRYRGESGIPRPNTRWMIEPQLEGERNNKNMKTDNGKTIYTYQAGDSDYKNTGFDRGHLFPSSYAHSKNDKTSTFTLTNVVPQEKTFNQGSWEKMESCIKCVLDEFCINNNGKVEAYLVTGAQPSSNNMLNDSVNIPSMLWSAFCCYSHEKEKWIASAHWGENAPDDENPTFLQTKTLAQLQIELSSLEVFPGTQCPLDTTVTQLYPELKKSCKCPPTTSGPLSTALNWIWNCILRTGRCIRAIIGRGKRNI